MVLRSHIGLALAVAGLALTLSGCSTLRLEARPNIPQPVVTQLPLVVGLYMPIEFSSYVYKGERYGYNWEISLGAAQSEGLSRLLAAMFDRVVPVDNLQAPPPGETAMRAILEPQVEEYSFVTPRDAGTPFYAVSIKYRVNVYSPDGRLAESWPFTGYGIVPSEGMSAQKPLARATALAMRDASAKLVVEFRDQAVIRGLIPAASEPDIVAPASEATSNGSEPAGEAPAADAAAPASEGPAPQGEAARKLNGNSIS